MATVTVKFDADTSAAKKQLADLQAAGQQTQAALAEGKPGDRRAALETLRTAKETLATAEKEKAEVQQKVKAQAQAVREAQAAVNAAKEGTSAHATAAKELERQQRSLERIKQLANIKGQAADQALLNVGMARRVTQLPVKVDAAPALSGFARIREAGLNAARRVASGFASMGSRIASAFSGLRGVVAGGLAALGINAGVQGLRSLINELDNLSKGARVLGVDTANFQKMSYAAQSMNVPFETVKNGMAVMQRTIGEAAKGSDQAAAKFAAIGLTLKDLDGMPAAEQFDTVARAINAIPDQAQRAAAAAEIFGKSGVKMLDYLREYKGIGDELAARGGIIDDAQLRAAEEFNQCITDISATLKSMTINSGLLKQMSELLKLMDFFISGKDKTMEQRAASMGVFNRKTASAFAAEKIIAGGNLTPAQQERLRRAAKRYGSGGSAREVVGAMVRDDYSKEYSLIDAELRRRGMGVLTRNERGRFGKDTNVTATRTPEEQAAEAKRLADARAARAAEAARREAVRQQAAQAQAEAFRQALAQSQTGGTGSSREDYIAKEVASAEALAQKYKQVLSTEQKTQIQQQAGARFDAAAQQKIDDYLASLKERYRLQQLIAAGKGREAAIEERLAEARRKAADAGQTLTAEQEQEIRDAAGGLYDLQHKQSAAGPGRIGADSYATYGLRSVGGLIEGASRVGTMAQDYPRQSAETLRDLQAQVSEIKAKLPERTEAGTTKLVL